MSKNDLILENNSLKEQINKFKVADVSKAEAVVELSNLNVVYRGVTNPVRISFPNAVKIEAEGKGLRKIDDFGNYQIVPVSGKTMDVVVKATMIDGSIITSIKKIRIKNIGKLIGKINNIGGCGSRCEVLFKKKDLIDAEIRVQSLGVLFDWEFNVISFKIKLPNIEPINIKGNKILMNNNFETLKKDNIIQIYDIRTTSSANIRAKKPMPIIIRIVD